MNTVCKEHEWKEIYASAYTYCKKCGEYKPKSTMTKEDWNDIANGRDNDPYILDGAKTDTSTDFKIEENVSIINKQEWEDIRRAFENDNKFKIYYGTFFDWLQENYLSPERK